jgi:hypothetical protein
MVHQNTNHIIKIKPVASEQTKQVPWAFIVKHDLKTQGDVVLACTPSCEDASCKI